MYTQQFIKSGKKIFLWYLYGCFREQIFKKSTILDKNIRAETNIRNVQNEPFSKRTNIRIFVRFDE